MVARLPFPPGLPPAERLSRLGRALLRLERLAEAETVFRQAVAADPASVPALKGLGRCLNRGRAWPEALEVWRRLIDLAPGWPEPPRQTVRLLCRLGRDGEAGELVAEAILSGRLAPAAVADLLEACGLARPAEAVLRRSLPVSRAQLVGLLIRDGRVGEARSRSIPTASTACPVGAPSRAVCWPTASLTPFQARRARAGRRPAPAPSALIDTLEGSEAGAGGASAPVRVTKGHLDPGARGVPNASSC